MKKFLIGLGALIVLVVLAALVGPRFIDWSRYKDEIATKVQAATGHALAIDGPISFALLPSPRLSAQAVRLANLPGAANPDMARLKALDLQVALVPLLRGRIQVVSLDLIEPQIALERLKDGRVNWQLTPQTVAPLGRATSSVHAGDGAGSLARLQLDRLAIRDGTISYRNDGTGGVYSLDRISGTFAMASPDGPLRTRGRAILHGLPVSFDGTLERLGSVHPASLGLKLAFGGAQLDFIGTLARQDDAPVLAGRLKLNGSDLRATSAALGLENAATLPSFLAQNFAIEGDANASAAKLTLSGLDFRLGESEATGALDLQPGTPSRVNIKLAMARVDLDKWLAMKAPPPEMSSSTSASGNTVALPPPPTPAPAPTASPAPAVTPLTLPTGFEGSLDATVDVLVYKGRVVRQLRFGAALNKNELALKELSAELPGSSDVTIYGTVQTPGGQPGFKGNVKANSDNLRDLLGWFKLDVGQVPAERLRKLALSAALQVTSSELQLRDIEASLDSSNIEGGANILIQERPAFGASLAVDRLNLDAYLTQDDATAPTAAPQAAPDKNAEPVADGPQTRGAAKIGPSHWLGDFDANIRARVDELIYRSQAIRGIQLDGAVQAGTVTLHQAQVDDLAGVKGQVSGSLAGLSDQPRLDLAFDLSAPELSTFLRFSGLKSPVAPAQLGAMAFKGHVTGGLDKLALDLDAGLAGGEYKLLGTAGLGRGGLDYDLKVAVKQPQLGGIELQANATGNADKLALSDLRGKLGQVSVSGAAEALLGSPRPKITAKLTTSAIDLGALLPSDEGASGAKPPRVRGGQRGQGVTGANPRWSTAPLDLAVLQSVDTDLTLATPSLTYGQYKIEGASLAATLSGGMLDLTSLTGKLYGGNVKITGKLDARAEPTATVALRLDGANLGQAGLRIGQVRLASGAFEATADLRTSGRSELALVRGLNGNGSLKMENGVIHGFDLPAINDRLGKPERALDLIGLVQGALAGGETKVKSLTGTFTVKDGIARNDDLVLDAEGATGKGQGSVDLLRWYMEYEIAFRLTGASDAPPFSVKLKGAPDEPRKFLDANALQEYLLKRAAASFSKRIQKGAPAPSGSQTTPDNAQPEQKLPAQIIQDLLKGLHKSP